MTIKADAAVFQSKLALAAAVCTPSAARTERLAVIHAHIAIRAVHKIGYGAIIAVAAFLAEIDIVDTCAAIQAMRGAVLTESTAPAKFIDTLTAFGTVVLVITAAFCVFAAMVAAVTNPVVGDKFSAILTVRFCFPRIR